MLNTSIVIGQEWRQSAPPSALSSRRSTAELLLARAGIALYAAKTAGKRTFKCFHEDGATHPGAFGVRSTLLNNGITLTGDVPMFES
ncbi:hypothetical protein ACKF11_04180 [Methylobacillus sp. Pita2]|uniref:hypothetical protein n=1 Tax=Methylobacillus sp. Pita2 TaxID=3383245 RepID=UPI0038B45B59